MSVDWTAALAALVGALVLLLALWLRRSRSNPLPHPLPPVRSGWLPWVGCAIPFGKEPLYFIQRTKEEVSRLLYEVELHSDVFTIHAAGKRMTFVTNSNDYHLYFTTTQTSFPAAVQPFTQNAAGLSPDSFSLYHTKVHDMVKGKLIPSYLAELCPHLSQEFHDTLSDYGSEGEMELMDFVRHSMFESVVRRLFGSENIPQTREKLREMERKFAKYDEDFEYGAELPDIFLKDWRECKYWLVSLFKLMVANISKDKGEQSQQEKTLVQNLIDTVDAKNAPNYALLLLWASQANAVPALFWTFAYILSSPQVYKSLKEDVSCITSTQEGTEEFRPVRVEELNSVLSPKRAVLEAIRLNAPGMITRKVMKDLVVNGYTVPAGHLMMLSPYWSHRDAEKFPDPENYNPDRWLACDLERNQFLDGFVGFGGGRYQCPGRWFALMEMHLFTVTVLRMFDLELLDPVPPPSPLHLVGTQQPAAGCRVRYRRC